MNHDIETNSKCEVRPRTTWETLKSNPQILSYPLISIGIQCLLVIVMSVLIINKPVSEFIKDSQQIFDAHYKKIHLLRQQTPATLKEKKQIEAATEAMEQNTIDLFNQQINFIWLFILVCIVFLTGTIFYAAMAQHALDGVRDRKNGMLACFKIAFTRLIPLVLFALMNLIVRFLPYALPTDHIVGRLIRWLLIYGWYAIAFFSLPVIMDTGCGPLRAVAESYKSMRKAIKKIRNEVTNLSSFFVLLCRIFACIFIIFLVCFFLPSFIIFLGYAIFFHHTHYGNMVASFFSGLFSTLLFSMLIVAYQAVIYVWANTKTRYITEDEIKNPARTYITQF